MKTISSGVRSNEGSGNWIPPVYPRLGTATTLKRVAANERVAIWFALSVIAIGVAIGITRSAYIAHQVTQLRERMSASQADRTEIHRELEGKQAKP